jgi:hypothetical protein
MTPTGIEPATFRFVAQYLNRCATISSSIECKVGLINWIFAKNMWMEDRRQLLYVLEPILMFYQKSQILCSMQLTIERDVNVS